MGWADFCKQFKKLQICSIFGENLDCQIINDRWEGKKNGGPAPIKKIEVDESPLELKHRPTFKIDPDDKWFLNPQWKLEV